MKKIIITLLIFLLSSCSNRRNKYYNFSFDDYSIVVGYDDEEYISLVFDIDNFDHSLEYVENIHISYWGDRFASIDFKKNKNDYIISKLKYDFNIKMSSYKIDNVELEKSVKNNCGNLNGSYLFNKTSACIISKKIKDINNIIILKGDIYNTDVDELAHVEIYVE